MRILFLTDGVHPFQLGGMQKHSLILCDLLLKKGLSIDVVHPGGKGYSAEKFKEQFTETEKLKEIQIDFPKTDPFPGHYIRENKAYSKSIYQAVREEMGSYDLIYAQGFTAWHFLKMKVAGEISLPIFVNFHGFEMYQKPPSLRVKAEYVLFKKTVKWMVNEADYVYSFGGQINRIIQNLGVAKDRIISQSNGIKADWIRSEVSSIGEERKFVFVGRNERRKGIEELNKALEVLLEDKSKRFNVQFVGPIPTEVQLKDDRIHYHGEIRDAEKIKAILDESDCLLCPSHSEGMPTVILEAMARGLAIMGTDVGAVSRMIDANGILLPTPEPKLIQSAIEKIIQLNSTQLEDYKKQSLRLVKEQFIWEVIAQQKINDFKEALK
ncbi:MAG: glycosyltransferase family 4 protein [Flavobacteriales bacterium]|nr:glycosyltransferase family 4 protein [Flavobacteriales bacterium]